MPEYISVTDTAKLIRKALKAQFPNVKFSVQSKSYSMGASITVYWTDGPTTDAVDKIVKQFEGASFDGMIDLKSYHSSMLDGREVHFDADYVFTQRSISNEDAKMELAKELIRCTCYVETDDKGNERFGNEWIDQLANRILWRQDYLKHDSLSDAMNKYFGHIRE